jgi:hypothetical protein
MSEDSFFVNEATNAHFSFTFALSVPVLHTVRSADKSFFEIVHRFNNNTPPMPLTDAHLGGFFVYNIPLILLKSKL